MTRPPHPFLSIYCTALTATHASPSQRTAPCPSPYVRHFSLIFFMSLPAFALIPNPQYKNTNAIAVEMKTTTEFRADDAQLERIVRLERGDGPGVDFVDRKR